ncbi:hypothetical protein SAMN02949497_1239 [Methylomagnum ishizawai]|uniref:Uncharacterized protein n=2 Tax=Methylomagnum ishizawai TaxID=1760988 RepID=A0A1Y6CZE5_9GAMM|nr:hypothetical protein SAMN02949497_1239 [Methylomagnum ishizawai]
MLPCLAYGCKIGELRSHKEVDPEEYIFIGKVVGYTSIDNAVCGFDNKCYKSYGMRVEIVQSFFLPNPKISQVDLYFFGLSAMCSRTNSNKFSEFNIKNNYIGEFIKIAARPLLSEPLSLTQSHQLKTNDPYSILLDGSDWVDAIIVPIDNEANSLSYRDHDFDYTLSSYTNKINFEVKFQIRKDLARLYKSTSEAEAKFILNRMANFTEFDRMFGDDFFIKLLKRYLHNQKTISDLDNKNKKAIFNEEHNTDN